MARSFFPFGNSRLFLQDVDALDSLQVGTAAMQEGSWGIDTDIKELHGRNRFAVDVKTGMGKIDGTAKFTDWDPDVIAAVLGMSTSTTFNKVAIFEDSTIPGTPFQVTVANSATFIRNLEVTYKATGERLTQVAATPTTGQYTVAAGVYTFVAGDAAKVVRICYVYSASANGKAVPLTNVSIGTTPVFKGVFQGISDAKQMVLELENVVPFGMKWASRIDDWMHQDISMKAFANPATDVIGQINIALA